MLYTILTEPGEFSCEVFIYVKPEPSLKLPTGSVLHEKAQWITNIYEKLRNYALWALLFGKNSCFSTYWAKVGPSEYIHIHPSRSLPTMVWSGSIQHHSPGLVGSSDWWPRATTGTSQDHQNCVYQNHWAKSLPVFIWAPSLVKYYIVLF